MLRRHRKYAFLLASLFVLLGLSSFLMIGYSKVERKIRRHKHRFSNRLVKKSFGRIHRFYDEEFEDHPRSDNLMELASSELTTAATSRNVLLWELLTAKGEIEDLEEEVYQAEYELRWLSSKYAKLVYSSREENPVIRPRASKSTVIRRESFMYLIEIAPVEQNMMDKMQKVVQDMQKKRRALMMKPDRSASLEYRELFAQYVWLFRLYASSMRYHGVPLRHMFDYWSLPYLPVNASQLWNNLTSQILPFYNEMHSYIEIQLGRKGIPTANGHVLSFDDHMRNILQQSISLPVYQESSITAGLRREKFTLGMIVLRAQEVIAEAFQFDAFPRDFELKTAFFPKNVCDSQTVDLFENGAGLMLCGEVSEKTYIEAFRLVGEVYFYFAYRRQNFIFRRASNLGMFKAVGKFFSLFALTPYTLRKFGIFNQDQQYSDGDRLIAMHTQLIDLYEHIRDYALEEWRTRVFQGKIDPKNYNAEWYKIRERYLGIRRPIEITEETFEPGMHPAIAGNVPFITNPIGDIMAYQIMNSLCGTVKINMLACQLSTMHENALAVSRNFWSMLKKGASIPWLKQIESLTGSGNVTATHFLRYMEPLRQHMLRVIRKENNGYLLHA